MATPTNTTRQRLNIPNCHHCHQCHHCHGDSEGKSTAEVKNFGIFRSHPLKCLHWRVPLSSRKCGISRWLFVQLVHSPPELAAHAAPLHCHPSVVTRPRGIVSWLSSECCTKGHDVMYAMSNTTFFGFFSFRRRAIRPPMKACTHGSFLSVTTNVDSSRNGKEWARLRWVCVKLLSLHLKIFNLYVSKWNGNFLKQWHFSHI